MIPSVGLLIFLFALFLCYDPSARVGARSVSRPQRNEILRRDPRSLASASWIWPASNESTTASSGNAAFFKDFDTPFGKTASSALITLTAVENFTLWINGQPIGASGGAQDQNGWKSAHVLRAALNASVNTFSILVLDGGSAGAPPPGLLVAIDVSYTDSTNSTLLSDATWLASRVIPSAFPSTVDLADLAHFAPAAVAAVYGGGAWGNGVSLPAADPSPLTLASSSWIWDSADAETDADVAQVGFRKSFSTPAGKRAVSADILLTADNDFALHVNNQYQGTPPGETAVGWRYAQQFSNIPLNADGNVFTVIAQNFQASDPTANNPAGLVAAIRVTFADGTSTTIPTDASWLTSKLGSVALFMAADDAQLGEAIALGAFGIAPWGELSGVSDILSAASVPKDLQSFSAPAASASAAPARAVPVPVGTIVAAVVGTLGALLVLGLLVTLLVRRNARRRQSQSQVGDMEAFSTAGAPFAQYSPNAASAPPSIVLPAATYSPMQEDVNPFIVPFEQPSLQQQPLRAGPEVPPPSYAPFAAAAGGSGSDRQHFVTVSRREKGPGPVAF